MFGLFKKKTNSVNITDKVWMTETALLNALLEEWDKDNSITFICWFDETLRKLETLFSKKTVSPVNLFTARTVSSHQLTGRIIFTEHYPLPEKEQMLYDKLKLTEADVWSSLETPLLRHFGGERTAQMMKKMGAVEEEAFQHPLISKAIRNAQQKVAAKVNLEQTASSQDDWFLKNRPT